MHRSVRRLLAVASAAALLTTLAPSAANAVAPHSIHGRLDDHGAGIPGVQVGYFEPRSKVKAWVHTDAAGRFSLTVPATATAGYLWAGPSPRRGHVTFRAHGVDYVGAVIGRPAPGRAPAALFQTQRAAAPDDIGGGGDLAIHLRRAARLGGSDASLRRALLLVRRGDGSVVQYIAADARGAYRSTPLAPGRYHVAIRPRGSAVSTGVGTVTLHSGATTALRSGVAALAGRRESVLAGRISAPPTVASVGVRVEVLRGAREVAAVRARRNGTWHVRGLAPGRYTVVAGRNTPENDNDTPFTHPTPDDTLAASRTVVVRAGRTTRADLRLGAAGSIAGRAPGLREVVVEDPTGTVVRVARVADDGGFTAGGLPGGRYTVIARDWSAYGTASASASAGTVTSVGTLAATRALPTVHGAVDATGLSSGEEIDLSADLVGPIGSYDTVNVLYGALYQAAADGTFSIEHVLPGLHRFVVRTGRTAMAKRTILTHDDSDPVDVRISDGTEAVRLRLGPLRGHLDGDLRTSTSYAAGFLPQVFAADGRRADLSGNALRAEYAIDARPGTYRWGRQDDFFIADDGPWWGRPAHPTIIVRAGRTTGSTVRVTIEH